MNVFTYGSLMDDGIRFNVLGHQVNGKYAELKDFELVDHSYCRFLTIKEKKGSVVRGLIMYELDEYDLARLDKYENGLYDKIVVYPNGEKCLAYIEKPYLLRCTLCSMTFNRGDLDLKYRLERHNEWHEKARIQGRNTTQGKPYYI